MLYLVQWGNTHVRPCKPECTVCLQPWGSHSQGKYIPKDCKFCLATSSGGTQPQMTWNQWRMGMSTPGLPAYHAEEPGDQGTTQWAHRAGPAAAPPSQGRPHPSQQRQAACLWYHPQQKNKQQVPLGQMLVFPLHHGCTLEIQHLGVSLGGHQPLLPSPTRQPPALVHGNPLPTVPAALALPGRQVPTTDAQPQQPWPSLVSPNMAQARGKGPASSLQQVSLATSLPPAQVPASIWGKIQCSEYVDLSELLAYDFQYRYSGLDDSQALEIIDGKLSLAPKHRARYLSTLQLWLWAWHLYEDTLLSFYPHRYLELSHYQHHISDLDQHFHWAAMLSYDAQFHHKCAVQGLPFSAFDQQLYITTLNATAAKVTAHRCFWCQHFNHEVIDCPFPLGAPLEKDLAMKKAAEGQQGQGMYRQQQQHSSTRGTSSQLTCFLPPGQGDLH